jgi:hypothetical protein
MMLQMNISDPMLNNRMDPKEIENNIRNLSPPNRERERLLMLISTENIASSPKATRKGRNSLSTNKYLNFLWVVRSWWHF